MASSPTTLWQIKGEKWKQWQILFSWAPKSLWTVTAAMKLKDACSLEEKLWRKDRILKSRAIADKGLYSQSYDFSSSHVWMWELDHKKGWAPKNWCFQIVILEETLETPLDSKEIKQISPKRNQYWIFIGKAKAEAEAPILWPSDSLEKSLMLGKIEGKRRR